MNFPAVSSVQVQIYLGYFVCFKSRAAPIQGQMQNARFSIMKQNSAGSADFFQAVSFGMCLNKFSINSREKIKSVKIFSNQNKEKAHEVNKIQVLNGNFMLLVVDFGWGLCQVHISCDFGQKKNSSYIFLFLE